LLDGLRRVTCGVGRQRGLFRHLNGGGVRAVREQRKELKESTNMP
jgi:hypothetical protein